MPMDSDEFGAHSVGFYKRGDQWAGAPSALVAAPGWLAAAQRCRHVSTCFPTRSGGSEESAATTLCGVSAANSGPLRLVSATLARCDQPYPLQSGDVALWCERSAGGGQRFLTVLVGGARGRGGHSGPRRWGGPFPLVMAHPPSRWMRGTSVDSRSRRHWCRVCCPTRAPRLPGPPPHTLKAPTEDPWGWLSPAGLASAVEDSVSVAANAVRHRGGQGAGTPPG